MLRLDPRLAPVKVAVLPLSRNADLSPKDATWRRPAPQLERRVRRRGRDRTSLPPPGRDRNAVLRHGRLRHARGQCGHGARARLHGAGPRIAIDEVTWLAARASAPSGQVGDALSTFADVQRGTTAFGQLGRKRRRGHRIYAALYSHRRERDAHASAVSCDEVAQVRARLAGVERPRATALRRAIRRRRRRQRSRAATATRRMRRDEDDAEVMTARIDVGKGSDAGRRR